MPVKTCTADTTLFCRIMFASAALLAALGIALAALSAHLPDRIFAVPAGRTKLHSAVEMQMWHAIALAMISLSYNRLNSTVGRWCCMTMLLGLLLFCVPVTLLALTGWSINGISIGRIAPYGGALLICSWLLAAIAALRN